MTAVPQSTFLYIKAEQFSEPYQVFCFNIMYY